MTDDLKRRFAEFVQLRRFHPRNGDGPRPEHQTDEELAATFTRQNGGHAADLLAWLRGERPELVGLA